MRPEDRRKFILNTAKRFGFVSISEAAKELHVSIETVRRDINKLAAEALLKKERGGATPFKPPFRKDKSYLWRSRDNQQEKIAIGNEAANMIRGNTVVAFAPGTSIEAVASQISDVEGVTLVTNSLKIADILLRKTASGEIKGQVLFVGGVLDAVNYFTKGASATDEIDRFHFDLCFIACTALSEAGASLYDVEECFYARHLMQHSAHSVLIAEREKLGKVSTYIVSGLDGFDRIITDDGAAIPEEIHRALENTKTELTVVKQV